MTKDNAAPASIKPSSARQRKRPRKITPEYLHNSGLYYLQRFASSSGNFHAVMIRKVRRSCMEHKEQDFEACRVLVDQLVEKFQSSGLLDDATYLQGSVRSLRRRGESRQSIMARLRTKGLSETQIRDALQQYEANSATPEHDPETVSALLFARKKKFPPFSLPKKEDSEKVIGSFARKGFNYDTIRAVTSIKRDEAEDILRNAGF